MVPRTAPAGRGRRVLRDHLLHVKCPTCGRAIAWSAGVSRASLLQRALPPDRPGRMAQRRSRDTGRAGRSGLAARGRGRRGAAGIRGPEPRRFPSWSGTRRWTLPGWSAGSATRSASQRRAASRPQRWWPRLAPAAGIAGVRAACGQEPDMIWLAAQAIRWWASSCRPGRRGLAAENGPIERVDRVAATSSNLTPRGSDPSRASSSWRTGGVAAGDAPALCGPAVGALAARDADAAGDDGVRPVEDEGPARRAGERGAYLRPAPTTRSSCWAATASLTTGRSSHSAASTRSPRRTTCRRR